MRILFFDGYCSLCNGLVDRLMRWDRGGRLKFASLQGKTAKKELPADRIRTADPETVIYLRDGQLFDRSTAILMVAKDLGGLWTISTLFFLVPRIVRDWVYKFVARIRYPVFGRRDTCRVPTPEERDRLLA